MNLVITVLEHDSSPHVTCRLMVPRGEIESLMNPVSEEAIGEMSLVSTCSTGSVALSKASNDGRRKFVRIGSLRISWINGDRPESTELYSREAGRSLSRWLNRPWKPLRYWQFRKRGGGTSMNADADGELSMVAEVVALLAGLAEGGSSVTNPSYLLDSYPRGQEGIGLSGPFSSPWALRGVSVTSDG
ncbi:hypothetical protein GW17_00035604 [Ensete ventricosum]|nr:hypothetical protein GW17_00035604 [Ensete ventricosum]